MTIRHSFSISREDVEVFGQLTGDLNPIHFDENFAVASRFGRTIVHGVLATGFISRVLGMDFPGPGTVFLEQSIRFVRPMYVDEQYEVVIKVERIVPEKARAYLTTDIVGSDGYEAIVGTALVMHESLRGKPH